jgi:predicted ATPase/DNA-binding NarL/FixJ family response regulator
MRPATLPGRLRGELTEFIGRRAELAQVRQALGSARLVTLTGPGGIGKTRLAVQVAASARRAFPDGVWLAELANLRDPALLVSEVARVLGLSDQPTRWVVATLSDHLAALHVLLVLDGCEHLSEACAVMADTLLRDCPRLHIMATSRHVLGVPGEFTVVVPPMAVPALTSSCGPDDLLQYEAVRLFTSRATAVLPGFMLDADNCSAVAGVCRALDGIPLAVELAAVRLRSLSPAQILTRLDSRFQLLSSGSPAAVPHHRTLQAALEWSYGLLTDAERALWRRVSVFTGSFDLDAAEAVCSGDEIPVEQVADLVDGLVAKSILLRDTARGPARYRLLDTIGEFGLQKLRVLGREREFRLRHREWYGALAGRWEAFGPGRAEWIAVLDTDHQNFRAALAFSLSQPQEVAAGASMACDLWRYWDTRGHLTEGRRILAALLENLDETDGVRPRAMWMAGYLAMVQMDLPAARRLLEAALSAAGSASDPQAIAYATTYLGYVLYSTAEAVRGRALVEDGLRLHRDHADVIGVVTSLLYCGFVHMCSGEYIKAADRFGECMELAESSGNLWAQAHAHWGLAVVSWLLGDVQEAGARASAGLRTGRHVDDRIAVAQCLEALAWVAASQKKSARAMTLLGAADSIRAAILAMRAGALSAHHDAALRPALAFLPGAERQEAYAKGAAMQPAEAVAYALGELPAAGPRGAGTSERRHRLTRREREVAMLVAQGLSNGQIASTLVISPRTAETHVQHIMTKLGFSTRAQIAAWSAATPEGQPPPRLSVGT